MRNELLGKRLVAALESRNMEAYYVETKEEAVKKALELIPKYRYKDVLLYLDPPYVLSSRAGGLQYAKEMSDADQLCHLAARYGIEHLESAQQVQDKLRDTVIRRDGKIHHNLDDEKDVDATAEVVVHLLLFPGFFECHNTYLLEVHVKR